MSTFDLEIQAAFLEEATQLVVDAEQCFLSLENSSADPAIIDQIFRLAHNLKGSGRAVGFGNLADFTHAFETYLLSIKKKERPVTPAVVTLLLACNDRISVLLRELKSDPASVHNNEDLVAQLQSSQPIDSQSIAPTIEAPAPTQTLAPAPAPAPDETLRVSLARIEKLVNAVGELVIVETVLSQNKELMPNPFLVKTITQLDKISREIRDLSLSLRMTKVKPVFLKLQRIVRDTTAALGKSVRLEMRGEDTEIDKTVLEALNDPLVHLIRNAVDHGIESAADRVLAGKTADGLVRISAYQRGDRIMIDVIDDGKGLDARKLIEKAIENGVIAPGTVLSDEEAHNLVFAAGFSTKSEASDISGRGV
ncbi:MAG: Hpt domain-containing protein, partial [Bdellovibrionota bacterium]